MKIIQFKDNQIAVQVALDKETIWMNLNQISELFERDKSVISKHIKNIFNEEELDKSSVVAKNATTALDGKTYYVEFVKEILEAEQSIKDGKGVKIKLEDLWK